MLVGTVVLLDPASGHGLLAVVGRLVRPGGRRVFPFHRADVRGGVPEVGRRVECSLCWPSHGSPWARDVRILRPPPAALTHRGR